jgi:hypothetical protein
MNNFKELEKRWFDYYSWIDKELRANLEAIDRRPKRKEDLEIEQQIPWKHLTLAGVRLKDYTVRIGRLYQTSPDYIKPDWEIEEDLTEEDEMKLWKKVWKELGWKHRPNGHYSAYWRIIHRRPIQAWITARRTDLHT